MMVVIWDLDGTIQDSEQLAKEGTRYGFQQVLGRDPTEDEFAQLVGRPVSFIYREWFGEQMGQQIHDTGSQYYEAHAAHIRSYHGVPELLHELHRQGYRMGIVSSKRRQFVERELKSKNLDVLFEEIVGQEDTKLHKPHPEPLLLATSKMDVDPVNCVYIGDQPSDIHAAHDAGMLSIAALWGSGKVERLEPAEPTMTAYRPMDILHFLSQNVSVER